MKDIKKKLSNGKKIIKQDDGRVRVVTVNDEPSLTRQEFQDETDINKIISKYRRTGMLTHLRKDPGQYMDLSNLGDYSESLQKVIDADAKFSSLSAELRKYFDNDPQKLINFMSDPNNHDKAVELGLIMKPKETYEPSKEASKEPKQADPALTPPAEQ